MGRRGAAVLGALAVLLLVLGPLPAGSAPADAASAGTPSAGTSPAVDGAPGAGDPYYPRAGAGDVDVRRYAIAVRHDPADGRLVGRTVVTLEVDRRLRSFGLDLLLPVRRVGVDGAPARWTQQGGDLRITPRQPLGTGRPHRVEVAYAGRPARVSGVDGEPSAFHTDGRESVVAGEPHAAPWWFPADDRPSDRARVDVRVTAPAGLRGISGGALVGRTRHGRLTTWHWRSREPVAPSLVLLAVGPYQERVRRVGGVTYRDEVSRTLDPQRRRSAADLLARTPRVVAWLGRQLGVPYPFADGGGLVTGLDLGFAMETQTRPVYPAVLPDPEAVLVHELGHQWFGDAVVLGAWRDVWLNEGPTTWLEHRWAAHRGGPSTSTWLRRTRAELADDDAFWRLPIDDPGPRALLAWPVYQRGAMAVQALREELGAEAFTALVRAWAGWRSPATTARFTGLAARLAGRDLAPFFTAWLHADGPPS